MALIAAGSAWTIARRAPAFAGARGYADWRSAIRRPRLILSLWCARAVRLRRRHRHAVPHRGLGAAVAAETLAGSWLYPSLFGEPFLTKPPGHYVAVALASLPAGRVTEVSARLPSAVAGWLAVLLVFATFRRYVSEQAAFVAALLTPSNIGWLDKCPSAEIDMLQLAWVAASLCGLLRAVEAHEFAAGRGALRWWLVAWLALAGGVLTKWTAPAFFGLTAVSLLAVRRRLRLLVGWRCLVGAVAMLAVVAGWAAAVAAEVGWPTLRDTVGREARQRFDPAARGRPYSVGEALAYPGLVVAICLPVSLLALYAVRPSFARLWDDRGRLLLQFLHAWTWPSLAFWTILPQHNVRYALPLTPGLLGLSLMVVVAWIDGRLAWPLPRMRPRTALIGVLATWAAVKVAFVEAVVPVRADKRNATATAADLNGLVPAGRLLYFCKLKDEGLAFYYGRPVRKFPPPSVPPEADAYVLLNRGERDDRSFLPNRIEVASLRDQQGAEVVLVRVP